MIELLALKLKEVSKKASNIDEKVENLAINQEKEINTRIIALYNDFKAEYETFVKNIPLPKDGKDFDLNLWIKAEEKLDTALENLNSKIKAIEAEIAKFIDEKNSEYNAFVK